MLLFAVLKGLIMHTPDRSDRSSSPLHGLDFSRQYISVICMICKISCGSCLPGGTCMGHLCASVRRLGSVRYDSCTTCRNGEYTLDCLHTLRGSCLRTYSAGIDDLQSRDLSACLYTGAGFIKLPAYVFFESFSIAACRVVLFIL